jgi:hypothetical protein
VPPRARTVLYSAARPRRDGSAACWPRREPVATDKPLGHATLHRRLEQVAEQITVSEAAVAVLGKGGVIRHAAVQTQSAEPAVKRG